MNNNRNYNNNSGNNNNSSSSRGNDSSINGNSSNGNSSNGNSSHGNIEYCEPNLVPITLELSPDITLCIKKPTVVLKNYKCKCSCDH